MTNQQLKEHCEDVIANPQDHRDWVVDMAKEALAALTEPVSPALKLPDPFSPHDAKMFCTAHGVTGAYELASKMANYAVDKVVRLNAPHTAPIEPICATGGAEWVKCSERMPEIGSTILVHMQDPIHSATPYAVATYDKYGFSRSKVTHWMFMPAAPEEE